MCVCVCVCGSLELVGRAGERNNLLEFVWECTKTRGESESLCVARDPGHRAVSVPAHRVPPPPSLRPSPPPPHSSVVNNNPRPAPMPHDLAPRPRNPVREAEATHLAQLGHHLADHAALQRDRKARTDSHGSCGTADHLRAARAAEVVLRAQITGDRAEQLVGCEADVHGGGRGERSFAPQCVARKAAAMQGGEHGVGVREHR